MVSSTLTAESGIMCQADLDVATRATGVCPRVRFGNSGGVGWMVFQYILVIFFIATNAVALYTSAQLQIIMDQEDIEKKQGQLAMIKKEEENTQMINNLRDQMPQMATTSGRATITRGNLQSVSIAR